MFISFFCENLVIILCLVDKTIEEKPDNVFKSEAMCDRGQNSSHTRALSDGHSIDTSNPC